jgi:hypothetical protein
MNFQIQSTQDKKIVLSALWVYLSLNYIYCDHLGFFEPYMIKDLLNGFVGNIPVSTSFLFGAAILMQIPFLMTLMCIVLPQKVVGYANIAASIIMIIVQLVTMNMGGAISTVYIFYSILEIIVNLIILYLSIARM